MSCGADQSPDAATGRPDDAVVMAIDPGSAKCGVAVVRRDLVVLHSEVIAVEQLLDRVNILAAAYRPEAILIGRGTGARTILLQMRRGTASPPILSVDEAHSSEEGRLLFLAQNPPRGWRRLIPSSLRTPNRPYDDYAAQVLAIRYWKAAER